jgi:queuosine precursor transporter
MKLPLALFAYAIAMTVANLSVLAFGPAITPVNAFVLIGFDLTMRDWLQAKLSPRQMGGLIVGTSLLTFALAPASATIALASAMAFGAAAVVDWTVFTSKWSGSTWLRKANASNTAAAAVDSIIFPTVAFGALMPHIVLMQFAAKVAGGALWAWIFHRFAFRKDGTAAI